MKYFIEGDSEPKTYSKGRSLEDLISFVESDLEGGCDLSSDESIAETCEEREQQYIEKMKVKSQDDISKELERVTNLAIKSMRKESKEWFIKRREILTQISYLNNVA